MINSSSSGLCLIHHHQRRPLPLMAGRSSSAGGRLPIRHGVGGFAVKSIHPFTQQPSTNTALVLDIQQWHGARQRIWKDKAPPRAPRQTTRETRRIHARCVRSVQQCRALSARYGLRQPAVLYAVATYAKCGCLRKARSMRDELASCLSSGLSGRFAKGHEQRSCHYPNRSAWSTAGRQGNGEQTGQSA